MPFLTKYQTDVPMMPILAKNLSQLINSVLSRNPRYETDDEDSNCLAILELMQKYNSTQRDPLRIVRSLRAT